MHRNIFLKQLFKVLVILAIFTFLVIWNPKNLLNPFQEVFAGANYAFQKFFSTVGSDTSGFFNFLGSISKLKDENEKLIKENNSLASQIDMLQE